jgi:predicted DNA-binding protein (UPF0251 family)/predicted Fe-Mo cluster-binding NifX family protein
MGREKIKRNLQFKPICIEFEPKECKSDRVIHLLHEEMEALFLMDIKRLYQADSAKEMGVSRATFARIIKSAREKVTMMLITGSNLKVEDKKEDYWVVVPSQKKSFIIDSIPSAKYLHIFEIKHKNIVQHIVIENPVKKLDLRPGQVIPNICNQHNINFFVANSIGEGLKSALLSKGVYSFVIDGEITIDKIYEKVLL